jgi:hypothetical protein
MKKSIFIFILFIGSLNSMPPDSNVFKYFPLNVGNRWTWFVFHNFSPGNGYESLTIQAAEVINNHVYYKTKRDLFYFYNNQHIITTQHYRIDSLTGNLYVYNVQNNTECLSDSLNSQLNDSANVVCGYGWYRYKTETYNIFSQNYNAKAFYWSNYFEGGSERKYAENTGRVYERSQFVMSSEIYTLRGCVINGVLRGDTSTFVGINHISSEVPEKFSLSQNYPNPFNPITYFEFRTADFGLVRLKVYDLLGKELQILVNEQLSPGIYRVDFDGSSLPSGVYYYKLESGDFTETRKMVLIK